MLSTGLYGLAIALVTSSAFGKPSKCVDPANLPELVIQLMVVDGNFVVDRAASAKTLDLKKSEFEQLFLVGKKSKEQLESELFDYADRTLASQGSVLRQLVLAGDGESTEPSPARIAAVDADIARLAERDPETKRLLAARSAWAKDPIRDAIANWGTGLKPADLPSAQAIGTLDGVMQRLSRHAFGDGPLMSTDWRLGDSSQERQARGRRMSEGNFRFIVSPPFISHAGDKLRPTTNAEQWDSVRSGFGEDVLKDFNGQLWRRADMLLRAQDYMALRGVELRPWRRFNEQDVLCQLVEKEDEPQGYLGIAPMRPRAGQIKGSGRIFVSSDPLPEAVYVVATPDQKKLALRALYLLLPSVDFDRVNADSGHYLEQTQEDWLIGPDQQRADAWRLKIVDGPGRDLRFAGMLMTRSALAERLQRLALLNYQARIDQVRDVRVDDRLPRRQGMLVLEPIPSAEPPAHNRVAPNPATPVEEEDDEEEQVEDAEASPVAPAPPVPGEQSATPEAKPAPKGKPLDSTSELRDVAAPPPLAEAPRAPSQRRHHLRLGLEHQAGKPLKAVGSFRRDGLTSKDTVEVDFGHNGTLQGAASYERDFVGFDRLGRRLQVSGKVYSDYTPDRVVGTVRTDVRRKGAQASGNLDLWRDWNGSFAQAEFTLARENAQAKDAAVGGVDPSAAWMRRVDTTLKVARSQPGTAKSMHDEAVLSTSFAQAETGSFQRVSVALNHHQFIGFFDRLDFRFFGRGVTNRAPATELPTFGGEESVRGLREDQASGRAVWALQSEWWMPVPWKTNSEARASLFRRQLALAVWVDTGAIYRPTTPFARQHTAVGLGLRYSQSDEVTLRLDVARPVAGLESEQRRTRLLLTVTMRPRL